MFASPFEEYMKPFQIWGNVYFCGSHAGSVHLIDTGDGLILLDTGYPQLLYQTIDNIYTLGFNPHDVKYIIHSHGHYDHTGATKQLVELTGAKTFLHKADLFMVDGDAKDCLPFTGSSFVGLEFHAFTPDVLIEDGDIIELGNTKIECVHTPGHTQGTVSFFFEAHDGNERRLCGMFGGAGLNTLNREYLERTGLSFDCRIQYPESLAKLEKRHVDIALGNHVGQVHTKEKLAARTAAFNPFDDPNEWQSMLAHFRQNYDTMIREEAQSD